jgi:hypothetical protein
MKKITGIIVLLVMVMIVATPAFSQCAMCTAVADEAAKSGSTAGDGINKGVLYLFLSPYLVVGTIGFIWWRSRREAQESLAQS